MKYLLIFIAIIMLIYNPVSASIISGAIDRGDGTYEICGHTEVILEGEANKSSDRAYIWVFGDGSNHIYGKQISIINDIYRARLPELKNFDYGNYTIVIQFAGENNMPDVIYNTSNNQFTTPWRVDITPEPVSNIPAKVKDQFYDMQKRSYYSDDILIEKKLYINKAWLTFTDQYIVQNDPKDISLNGKLYIGGKTNMRSEDNITVTVDYTDTEIYRAQVDDMPAGPRTWWAVANVSKKRPGDHYVVIESDQTDPIRNIFTIAEYIPTPTPTLEKKRYVSNQFVSSSSTYTTSTPTPTPVSQPMSTSSKPEFVPIVTTIVDTPLPAPSGAVMINPTSTNKIYSINLSETQPPSSGKLSLDILIPLSGLLLSYFIMRKL